MFDRQASQPHITLGVTRPIYVPRSAKSKKIRPLNDYFYIQVHSAQAVFNGRLWEQARQLVITSRVNLNHPILGNEDLRAIQRSRAIRKNHAEQLGLSPNLIALVPASMTHVSITIEFILDKMNYLGMLSGLINDDTFLATISLAPGAALVAKTISGLAGKVINTFIPPEEQQAILQFSGDFNLDAEDGLKDGYYVILGSSDDRNPLPRPLPQLSIQGTDLLADGKSVTQYSYVVLEVGRSPARLRDRSDNPAWLKLRQAEALALTTGQESSLPPEEKAAAWQQCRKLLQEAYPLLVNDPSYLPKEMDLIYRMVYVQCSEAISGQREGDRFRGTAGPTDWQPDPAADRAFLGLPLNQELTADLDAYAEEVAEARRALRDVKF